LVDNFPYGFQKIPNDPTPYQPINHGIFSSAEKKPSDAEGLALQQPAPHQSWPRRDAVGGE